MKDSYGENLTDKWHGTFGYVCIHTLYWNMYNTIYSKNKLIYNLINTISQIAKLLKLQ